MINVECPDPPPDVARRLRERTRQAAPWNRYKPTQVASDREMRETLVQAFNGKCGYCERSEAVSIDHFWPKHHYPERTWDWENFIVACSTCQEKKLDRVPVNDMGHRMVNPREEEPLNFLRMNPVDGKIYARPTGDGREQRGAFTITILHLDKRPALDKDRQMIYRYVQLLIVKIIHARTPDTERTKAWEDLKLLLDERQSSLAIIQQLFTLPPPDMEPLIEELYRVIPEAYEFFARFRRDVW